MFCGNCGSKLEGNERFCGVCGAAVPALEQTLDLGQKKAAPQKPVRRRKGRSPAVLLVILTVLLLAAAAAALLSLKPWDQGGDAWSAEESEREETASEEPEERPEPSEQPAEEAPGEEPAEESPAEELPAEEKPAEEPPTEEKPAEKPPVEEKPAEKPPVEEEPAEEQPPQEQLPLFVETMRGLKLTLPAGFELVEDAGLATGLGMANTLYVHEETGMYLIITDMTHAAWGEEIFDETYSSLQNDTVTYDHYETNMFAVSGYENGSGDIYYYRGIDTDTAFFCLEFVYPQSQRDICDGMLEEILKTITY